ncbi:hypothetical protein HDE_10999 [Halotydeus destructor]|nr:hypothetical protein HDE_10999 [Halotydeus destructor]
MAAAQIPVISQSTAEATETRPQDGAGPDEELSSERQLAQSQPSDVIEPLVTYKTASHQYHRGTRNGQRVLFKFCSHPKWTPYEEANVEALENIDRNRVQLLNGVGRLTGQVSRMNSCLLDTQIVSRRLQEEVNDLVNLQTVQNETNEQINGSLALLVSEVRQLKTAILDDLPERLARAFNGILVPFADEAVESDSAESKMAASSSSPVINEVNENLN